MSDSAWSKLWFHWFTPWSPLGWYLA
jgi:hypothetical protein